MDIATLNQAVTDLKWHYGSSRRSQTLKVNGYPEIIFPSTAQGGDAPQHEKWIRRRHQHGKIHEPATIAALAAVVPGLPPTGDVFDIGALYGYFALVAASMLPEAPIHAFEANPTSFDVMVINFAANPKLNPSRLQPRQLAVSDAPSEHVQVDIRGLTLVENQGESTMDFTSVDYYTEQHDAHPSLLKIDVEGFQAKVLPGAMGVVAKFRPVVLLEFDKPEKLARFGTSNKELLIPFADLGYHLYWTASHRELLPFHEVKVADMGPEHETNSLGVLIPD